MVGCGLWPLGELLSEMFTDTVLRGARIKCNLQNSLASSITT